MAKSKSKLKTARDKVLLSLLLGQLKKWTDSELADNARELLNHIGPIEAIQRLAREYKAFVASPQDLTIHWTNFTLNLKFGFWIDDVEDTSRDLIVYPVNKEFNLHTYDDSTSKQMRRIEDADYIESFKNSSGILRSDDLRFLQSKARPMTEYCFVPILSVTNGLLSIDVKDVEIGIRAVMQSILTKCGSKKPAYKRILLTTLGFDEQHDKIPEMIGVVWKELRAGGHRRLLGDWTTPEGLNIDLAYGSPVALAHFLKQSIHDGEVLKATISGQKRQQTDSDEQQHLSPQTKTLCGKAVELAGRDGLVVLAGERGVGCDAVARHIYHNSAHSGLGFVKVNCAYIPSDEFRRNLLQSSANIGYLEQAEGGALYFDRIDELPIENQAVLQEFLTKQIESRQVLVLASTRPSVATLVEKGLFRDDLYRLIRHSVLEVPPLRKQGNELGSILSAVEQQTNAERNKVPLSWTTEVVDYLKSYAWPDNFYEAARVVRVLSDVLPDGNVAIADVREHLPEIADAVDYGDTSETGIPLNISKTWQRNFQSTFIELRKSDKWDALEHEVSQLSSVLYTKITSTSGIKSGNFRDYLSSEMPAAGDRILRMLVARRVLIALYHTLILKDKGDRYDAFIRQLGFRAIGEKDIYGQDAPDEGNFKELVTQIGLKKRIIEDPYRSKGLWMEELKWLERNAIHVRNDGD